MLILYDNLLAKSSMAGYALSASPGSASGYDVANAADWLDFDFWKSSAAGVSYIEVDFTSAQSADTLALYAHDLYTNGASVKVKRYDGGAWTQVGTTLTPTSNGMQLLQFASVSDTKWRVEVTSTPASKIGVAFLGAALSISSGPELPFAPPIVPASDTVTNRSAGGALLGISAKPKTADINIDIAYQTPSWIRTYWKPFMQHAARRTFILAWDEVNYPTETYWCWCDAPLANPQLTHQTYMTANLTCKATDGL